MGVIVWKLFLAFFQIGLFSIGGGYAIIPQIQQLVVEKYQWISQKIFTDIITISQMTPGPLAVNTSTFVGLQIGGIPGAAAATVGCVLSGIVISVLLYRFFCRHRQSDYAFQVLNGLKAASLGLIVSAAATLLLQTFTGVVEIKDAAGIDWAAAVVFAAALAVLRKFKLNPMLVMVVTGVVGILVYLVADFSA